MNIFSSLSALLLIIVTTNLSFASQDSLESVLSNKDLPAEKAIEAKLNFIKSLNYSGSRTDTLSLECIKNARQIKSLALEAKASYARTRYLATKHTADTTYHQLANFIDSVSQILPEEKELYLYARVAKGKAHWLARDYEKAALEFKKAITFAEQNNLSGEYFFLRTNLALNQGLARQFFEAINTSNLSLDDPGARPYFVHANLADLYGQINDWDNYLIHAALLLEEAEEIKDAQAIFVGHIRKAEGLNKTGHIAESKQLLQSLLARKDVLENHSMWYMSIYNALIELYIESEEWDLGISIVDSLAKMTVDKRYTYATLAGMIGQCYLKKGEVNEAITWCEDGKAVAMSSGSRKIHYLPTVCECLSEAYHMKGDYQKAFENLSMADKNSSIKKEQEKILDLSRALNQQELRKQEEILVLEQAKKDAEHQARLSKYKYFGFFSLLITLVSFVFIRKIRERNKRINKSNSLLTKALEEKDLLLKEIHHRVKNNLQVISSLLSLQSRYVEDEIAVSALNEGQNRVNSMALIHQNLYREDNVSGVNMQEYIPLLADSIFNSYNIQGDSAKIEYDIDPLTLDVATVIPIGLVLNELISNALKYAFPNDQKGILKISLLEKQNALLLSVVDNGIGMSDKHPNTGFGTKLIRSFTRKLEGELKVNLDNGTAIEIIIKKFKRA